MLLFSYLLLSEFPVGGVFALGLIAIIIVVVMIVASHSLDEGRIKNYIAEKKGGQFISKQWKPFGRGWFGDKSDRIYLVQYKDKNGDIYEAFVKTSMFSGVYLSEEKLIKSNALPKEIKESANLETWTTRELIAEITRLQEENERLKRRK